MRPSWNQIVLFCICDWIVLIAKFYFFRNRNSQFSQSILQPCYFCAVQEKSCTAVHQFSHLWSGWNKGLGAITVEVHLGLGCIKNKGAFRVWVQLRLEWNWGVIRVGVLLYSVKDLPISLEMISSWIQIVPEFVWMWGGGSPSRNDSWLVNPRRTFISKT